MKWSTYRLESESSPSVGVTVHELDSGVPGPTLLILGGVHGDEVGGVVAAGSICRKKWELVRGRLMVVPIAHEAAYAANSRLSPLDGGNLARSFHDGSNGNPTQELADLIAHKLITHANVLIDLHTGNAGTDMPLFVGCLDDGSPAADRAVQFAANFGMNVVWTHPDLGPGRSLGAANRLGIPALYTESPAGGVLEERFIAAYVDGVASVLEGLGQLHASHERAGPDLWLHGNGDFDAMSVAQVGGLFLRRVGLLDFVEGGDIVGEILDSEGSVVVEVAAPMRGYVTTLQRAALVGKGHPIIGVTAEHPRRGGG